jgi:hypothetical protein
VLDGEITQDEEDGPVTAGEEGAIITFDEPIGEIGSSVDTDRAGVTALAVMSDGGVITLALFGAVDDLLEGSVATTLERSGADFVFIMHNSLSSEGGGSEIPPDPADPDGELYVSTEWGDNGMTNPEVYIFELEEENPECRFGSSEDTFENGNGDRIGVRFQDVELRDFSVDEYLYEMNAEC